MRISRGAGLVLLTLGRVGARAEPPRRLPPRINTKAGCIIALLLISLLWMTSAQSPPRLNLLLSENENCSHTLLWLFKLEISADEFVDALNSRPILCFTYKHDYWFIKECYCFPLLKTLAKNESLKSNNLKMLYYGKLCQKNAQRRLLMKMRLCPIKRLHTHKINSSWMGFFWRQEMIRTGIVVIQASVSTWVTPVIRVLMKRTTTSDHNSRV